MNKLAISVAVVIALAIANPAVSPARAAVATPNGAWPAYHHDDAHTGLDPSLAPVTSASAGWVSAALDGQVYAEPLVQNGLVYAVTLNNTVYAIDQASGATVWSTNLGAPQTSGWVCGNVSPMGILGTPVIDAAAGRIYVAAELGADHLYTVFGLDLATGMTRLTTNIPASIGTGFDWKIQQERGALALANGYVYVPFGGRAGDCFDGATPYWGWVVGVPIGGVGPPKVFETPSGAESVWAGGGVVVDDTTHNVFFATGNAIPCSGAMMSDSIVRVSPTLTSPTFFQPNDWQANWCGPDSDLGSASPVLISPNLMFSAGKHGGGFLLDPNNLGGQNGQLFPARSPYQQADVCLGTNANATFGSFAYAAPYVYLQCNGHGIVALKVDTAAPSFSLCGSTCGAPSWHTASAATFGPPIVAGGVVWAIDIGGSGLYGFNAATGAVVFQSAGFGVNHFVTPSEAGGRLFVPAGTRIRTFVTQSASSAESLGGRLIFGPDAASWGANHMDVFVVGTDSALYHKTWLGSSWSAWESLGGRLTADPAAVSWGPNRIDVFGRGTDNALYHRAWTGSSWSDWELLGGRLIFGPDVAAWGVNRLDVFVVGTDSALYHKTWLGSGWSDWEGLGGRLTADPGAVSWGPNRIDVFGRGTDSALYHRAWLGSRWSGWEGLGSTVLGSGPDASSCASGHLDVLIVGTDQLLWRKGWDGTQWSGWQSLGGTWTADPSAVCEPGSGGQAFLAAPTPRSGTRPSSRPEASRARQVQLGRETTCQGARSVPTAKMSTNPADRASAAGSSSHWVWPSSSQGDHDDPFQDLC